MPKLSTRQSFTFLGVDTHENLTWSLNTSSLIKKAQQLLYLLRRLKRAQLSYKHLTNFYRCAVESKITSYITVWYGNCSVADQMARQQVVRAA